MVEMTAYTPGTPSWVDVSTPNLEATKAFYGALFGWEAITFPDMGSYTDFTLNGKLVCGGVPTMSPDQHPAWGTYISVTDADATAQAVQDQGEHVPYPPRDEVSHGRMAIFLDPTGGVFAA